MTEQELFQESERLIDEVTREIEAIREALEANREVLSGPSRNALENMTAVSQDGAGARTN